MSSEATPEPSTELEEVTVTVRGLAVGGSAVGRVSGPEGSTLVGMTAFVPFAAPGETVRARVLRRFPRYLEGELLAVETASPDRLTPRCPYFGVCGGCDTQHLAYDAQLAAKQEMVRGAFRTSGLAELADKINLIVGGPDYGYRRRVTLHVGADGSLGYFRRRSHTLLPVTECPIAVDEISRFLSSGFAFSGFSGTGGETVGDLSVEAGENGLFGVLRLPGGLPSGLDAVALVGRMRDAFVGGSLVVAGATLARFGEESLVLRAEGGAASEAADRAEEGPGRAAPGAFSQVNAAVNEKLVAAIVQAASVAADRKGALTAYDLYAGSGNFSLPLAARGWTVTAVEANPALVATGRGEAEERGLADRVKFVEGTVERFARSRPRPATLLVADPPRTGLGKLAPYLTFGRNLALVSCDLANAVRDVKALGQAGWKATAVTPFDMFAQTTHVELLTLFER